MSASLWKTNLPNPKTRAKNFAVGRFMDFFRRKERGSLMVSDVKQIGELFKRKREEKNLSLKEVESSTSIRSSYLEAIEEGRENQFLSKVYMYGFMRQYAHFLELDVDVLSQDYSLPFENREEMSDFSYGIGTIEMRKGTLKSTNKWMPNLMWAAGSFGVLILAWLLAKYLGVV